MAKFAQVLPKLQVSINETSMIYMYIYIRELLATPIEGHSAKRLV